MNAMEAADLLEKLNDQINAIHRIEYYLKDNDSTRESVGHLYDVRDRLQKEFDDLADKLRAVQL